MPVISRFHGIVIKMYFRQKEHNPPHIHAICDECFGMFAISVGKMLEGDMPLKEQSLVKKFIEQNQQKLLHMWETQEFEMLSLGK